MWQELLPHIYTPYIYVVIIIYICAMEKSKFLQQNCSIHINEVDRRYFILIEYRGEKVINVMYVEVPDVLHYWDPTFSYYPFIWN